MRQIVTGLQSYFALGMLPSTRISVARAAVGKLKVGPRGEFVPAASRDLLPPSVEFPETRF
jgi:hypothetical protein